VPRSLIAEPLADGTLDAWLTERTAACSTCAPATAAWPCWPRWPGPKCTVDAADLSADALAVARLQCRPPRPGNRITLLPGRWPGRRAGRYDLILCNPPYVNRRDGGAAGRVPRRAGAGAGRWRTTAWTSSARCCARPRHLSAHGVLVLEIGHERAALRAAFPTLPVVWLPTSAGDDQVLLLTRGTARPPCMITLRNITLRRGTKVCCKAPASRCSPAKRSA
jgi:ribosomal protein L3 glutamine methyltransferase